jgi:hypothetical protein
MRFNPDKRFLDKIDKIELSLSAQGKEEFRPNAFQPIPIILKIRLILSKPSSNAPW